MIKLKQRLIIYMSGILFLLAGCAQEGFNDNNPGAEEPLTFSFFLEGITTNSSTRAAISPQVGETSVESLHLLFFEAKGDQSGALATVVSLPNSPSGGTVGKLSMETSYVLPTTGDFNASKAYHVIGIGNLGKYIPEDDDSSTNKNEEIEAWLSQWTGVTEAFFRDYAAVEAFGTDNEADYTTHRPINLNELLMNGYVDKPASTKNIQMVLKRNVARFDIENKSAATPLQTVSIWNAFTKSSITGDAIFNYTSDGLHTKRFYGISTGGADKVIGGLYAFANYSETPTINDKFTTNLIVGLKKSGSTRYYRINVNSNGTSQLLKNNYAYNITILTVTGDGYPTEEEAWEGTTNQLVYEVNFWGVDDNGLIVSDEFSLLAVPVKTVKIGPDGGESSYSITTFSTLDNPAPLRIKSQLYDPTDGNITARIIDGSLVITALRMNTGETKRSGIITITFAGLETSVNVLQSADAGTYLEVTLDEGWTEFLPPTANAMTEYINVKASGTWTARLYGSTNFAFKNLLGNYVQQISSIEFTNNRFHVYTQAANIDNVKIEKAFVLISLDSDPENYIAVVPVNQSSKGGIGTTPAGLDAIWFHGSGNLREDMAAKNQMTSNTHFRFKVTSTGSIAANNVRLTGTDYDKFGFEYNATNGNITVWAKDRNLTANAFNAVLSVSDNRNATLLVSLVQGTQDLTVTPPDKTRKVPAKGGDSDPIVITIDGGVQWKATIKTESNGMRPIFNHIAELYTEDGIKYVEGTSTNKNFFVKFPKVYFPNRETEIKAVVEISIDGSTKKCEVYQEALMAKPVKIWNLRYSSKTLYYGALGNEYLENYTTAIHNLLPGNGSEGSKWTSVLNPGTDYPQNTNYIHVGNYFHTDINWSAVNSFRTKEDGIIVFTNDEYSSASRNRADNFLNPLGFSSYVTGSSTSSAAPRLTANIGNSRIGLFLTTHGLNACSTSISSFQHNGVNTYIKNIPQTAVSVMTDNEGNIVMAIDPAQRVVYIGECEIFDQTGGSNDNRYKFMMNFVQYVINSAKYGSHFTDMLRKDGDFPTKIPPMWDKDTWNDNRWPLYSN